MIENQNLRCKNPTLKKKRRGRRTLRGTPSAEAEGHVHESTDTSIDTEGKGIASERDNLQRTNRWITSNKPERMTIPLLKESDHPDPFWNSRFLSYVQGYYHENSTILDHEPNFSFVPEHERKEGDKVFWPVTRFDEWWCPTFQGYGQHTARACMDYIKKIYSFFAAKPTPIRRITEPISSQFRWYATTSRST